VSLRPAIFLDRDGVLNELVPDPISGEGESPLRVADVRLIDGAAAAAARLRAAGFVLAGVTNQPAAAKGTLGIEALQAIHARVLELLADEGVVLDGWRICLHHPEGQVEALSGPCDCRKPAPGMLLDLAGELSIDLPRSWMVGDTDTDVLAGRAAGCRTVLVTHRLSAHKRSDTMAADLEVSNLNEATPQLSDPAVRYTSSDA